MRPDTTIIGMGNPILSDDAVGVHLARDVNLAVRARASSAKVTVKSRGEVASAGQALAGGSPALPNCSVQRCVCLR